MTRLFRPFSILIVCCIVVSFVTNPVSGQSTQQLLQDAEATLRTLEQRRGELTTLIATKEQEFAGINNEIFAITETLFVYKTQHELLADLYEETFDKRREPENTRLQVAIAGFKKGDPTSNALIDEVRALENQQTGTKRRLLYEAVIADANERLNILNAALRDTAQELDINRQDTAESQTALTQAQSAKSALNEEITDAGAELQTTLASIQNTNLKIAEIKARRITAILTGVEIENEVTRPALAVKIDNTSAARPQAGINQADIVFVEQVESRLTRLAAVFHSKAPREVGPVRSMRTSDLDLLAQLNSPLFANSGGNRGTRAALSRSTLVDIGVSAASSLYYRSSSRRAPHNLFTNAANLFSAGSAIEAAGLPAAMFSFRQDNDPLNSTAAPASTIDINYGNATVNYRWNQTSWQRSQDGKAMVDKDGVRVSPTTVIVQFTNYRRSSADARSPEAITVGSGDALIFSDGHVIAGRWSRPEVENTTTYTDSDGQNISILPGQVWVELPRADSTTYS